MSELLTLPPLNSIPFADGAKVIVHPDYKFDNDPLISGITNRSDFHKERRQAFYKEIENAGLYTTPGTIDADELLKDPDVPNDDPSVSEVVRTSDEGIHFIERRFLIPQPKGGKRKSRRNKKTKPGKPNKKRRKKTNRRSRR